MDYLIVIASVYFTLRVLDMLAEIITVIKERW